MHKTDALLGLIADIYQAAIEPRNWPMVLKSLAQVFKGHAAFTMRVGAGAHDGPELNIYNLPIESFVSYGEYYYQHDLWSPPWISQGLHGLGSVYSGDQLVDEATFKKSIWFNEFLLPLDIEHSLFAALSDGSSTPTILVIDRSLGSPAFTNIERKQLQPIAKHFSRALEISRQFQFLNAGIKAVEEATSNLNLGIVSIRFNGKLIYANEFAENLFRQEDGLTVKDGILTAYSQVGIQHLVIMLNMAMRGIGHVWQLERKPPNTPLQIKSLPFLHQTTESNISDNCNPGKVLLLINPINNSNSTPFQDFANRYHLTRQETKALEGLVNGHSAKEIAESHHVSHNTVRTQLASLLQKTGCKRQKELLALFFQNKNL